MFVIFDMVIIDRVGFLNNKHRINVACSRDDERFDRCRGHFYYLIKYKYRESFQYIIFTNQILWRKLVKKSNTSFEFFTWIKTFRCEREIQHDFDVHHF